MNYPTSFNVIVIILSVTLFVFLILGIVVLVKALKIMSNVQRMTAKAEKLTDNVQNIAKIFEARAFTASLTNIVSNVTDFVKNRQAKK